MHKPKSIENIKTILLVVLFLSTVLLLYFFWDNLSFKGLSFLDLAPITSSELAPTASEVMIPEEIAIHFGGGSYTVLDTKDQSLWRDCMDQIKSFTRKKDVILEEITYQKYLEVMNLRSICYSFSYNIPFASFCEKYGITKIPAYERISNLKSVSYSVGSPESLFIEDGINSKYYRLAGRGELNYFTEMINKEERPDNPAYYRLGTLVGGKSRTIVPLYIETKLKEIPFITENPNKNDLTSKNIAQQFFGSSLDFTRRVTESNGTIIYMYGYGQKVLRINKDGSVEYKEEPIDANPSQNYYNGLDLALDFVNNHGTWKMGTSEGLFYPYLQQVRGIEKNKLKGYRFNFGYKTACGDIFYKKDSAIVVEVMGGQVSYYRRDVISPKPSGLPEGTTICLPESEKTPISIGNIIALSYEDLAYVLREVGRNVEGESQEILFNSITEKVQHVASGYLRQEKTLLPVWIIRIGDIQFYFDLYDGKLLGHENIEV